MVTGLEFRFSFASYHLVGLVNNYIHQVNRVKLADILFSLDVCLCVCPSVHERSQWKDVEHTMLFTAIYYCQATKLEAIRFIGYSLLVIPPPTVVAGGIIFYY